MKGRRDGEIQPTVNRKRKKFMKMRRKREREEKEIYQNEKNHEKGKRFIDKSTVHKRVEVLMKMLMTARRGKGEK